MKSEIDVKAAKVAKYQKYHVRVKQIVEHEGQADLEFAIDELQKLCRRKCLQQIEADEEMQRRK